MPEALGHLEEIEEVLELFDLGNHEVALAVPLDQPRLFEASDDLEHLFLGQADPIGQPALRNGQRRNASGPSKRYLRQPRR